MHWGSLPGGTEYLFSATLPGRRIDHWLRDTAAAPTTANRDARRALLAALGVFIGRIHAAGFIHGDLRPGNVLADQRGDCFQFALLDNERNQRKSPPPGRLLLRNLMQLNMLSANLLCRTDRMRFFRAWRSHLLEYSPAESKLLAAEAYRWSMRRMAKPAAQQSVQPGPPTDTHQAAGSL